MEASWSSKAHDVTTLESKMDFVFLNNSLRGIHIYTDKCTLTSTGRNTQRDVPEAARACVSCLGLVVFLRETKI